MRYDESPAISIFVSEAALRKMRVRRLLSGAVVGLPGLLLSVGGVYLAESLLASKILIGLLGFASMVLIVTSIAWTISGYPANLIAKELHIDGTNLHERWINGKVFPATKISHAFERDWGIDFALADPTSPHGSRGVQVPLPPAARQALVVRLQTETPIFVEHNRWIMSLPKFMGAVFALSAVATPLLLGFKLARPLLLFGLLAGVYAVFGLRTSLIAFVALVLFGAARFVYRKIAASHARA